MFMTIDQPSVYPLLLGLRRHHRVVGAGVWMFMSINQPSVYPLLLCL